MENGSRANSLNCIRYYIPSAALTWINFGAVRSAAEPTMAPEVGAQGATSRHRNGLLHDGGKRWRRYEISAFVRVCPRPLSLAKRPTENERSDFSHLWHDGCGKQ